MSKLDRLKQPEWTSKAKQNKTKKYKKIYIKLNGNFQFGNSSYHILIDAHSILVLYNNLLRLFQQEKHVLLFTKYFTNVHFFSISNYEIPLPKWP